jgi:plasmid stability protein
VINTISVGTHLDEDVLRELEIIATEFHVSVAAVVREIIYETLDYNPTKDPLYRDMSKHYQNK